jgi:hypothetical protein
MPGPDRGRRGRSSGVVSSVPWRMALLLSRSPSQRPITGPPERRDRAAVRRSFSRGTRGGGAARVETAATALPLGGKGSSAALAIAFHGGCRVSSRNAVALAMVGRRGRHLAPAVASSHKPPAPYTEATTVVPRLIDAPVRGPVCATASMRLDTAVAPAWPHLRAAAFVARTSASLPMTRQPLRATGSRLVYVGRTSASCPK